MQPTATSPSWVQGMRRVEDNAAHPLAWQELLFRRLTGKFAGIPSGATTLESELALGFSDRMVYYYVGRCHPSFGSNAIASQLLEKDAGDSSRVTPFDTGALAKGDLIALSDDLANSDYGQFVTDNSFQGLDYVIPMCNWMKEAFDSPSDYARGEVPARHAVADIDLATSGGDERVWTWESRLPAVDYPTPPVAIQRIFFSIEHREPYLDWVRQFAPLSAAQKLAHMREIYAYSAEINDAVDGMNEFLRSESIGR